MLNFINLRKYVSLKPVGHYDIKQHLKPILILFAQVVAVNIYTNLDNVMLGFMKTDVDVGLYAAAVKVKTILTSLVTSLGAVLLPRLSYYNYGRKKKEFQTLIRKAYNFVIVIALPLMLFTIFYARDCFSISFRKRVYWSNIGDAGYCTNNCFDWIIKFIGNSGINTIE